MQHDKCLLLPKGGLNEGSAELFEAVYEATAAGWGGAAAAESYPTS